MLFPLSSSSSSHPLVSTRLYLLFILALLSSLETTESFSSLAMMMLGRHHFHRTCIGSSSNSRTRRSQVMTSRMMSLTTSMTEQRNSTTTAESSSSSSSSYTITSSTPRNTPTTKQKVAVVGSGAVGSYYGARLFEAGHDVQFYMRNAHYETSREQGLRIASVHGAVEIASRDLNVFDDPSEMDEADWIVVSLKSSSLEAIAPLIVPSLLRADNQTRILVIMNGLVEDDLIKMMKEATGQDDDDDSDDDKNAPLSCCRALYGGMAFICCNRLAPGHVDHSYAGTLSAGVASSTTGGDDSHEDDDDDRLAFEELWSSCPKQDIVWEPSLLRGRWKKMIWNLPFNGISVAMGGITVDKIVQDPSLRKLALTIMDETIAAANADMENQGSSSFEPLGEADKQKMMELTDTMGPYRTSTMLDLTNRQTMEVEYLFRKPVERAKRLGVPVPHLETILSMIEAHQRFYNLF